MFETKNKIYELENLKRTVKGWKLKSKKIVFTNGCFDLLHLGHIDYLEKAAKKGDKLIIGVNADSSVSKLKGNHRPIKDEDSRLAILAALHFVDAVVLFNEETPLNLITELNPDTLVKGADYTIKTIVGAEFVLNNGGKVETIEYLDGYSTSLLEKRIITSHNK